MPVNNWRRISVRAMNSSMKQVLDVKGLACPLPVLKAKKRLKGMASGEILVVQATDPGSVRDFRAFAEMTGHELVATSEAGDIFTFELRRR